jgi:hypothetical protein
MKSLTSFNAVLAGILVASIVVFGFESSPPAPPLTSFVTMALTLGLFVSFFILFEFLRLVGEKNIERTKMWKEYSEDPESFVKKHGYDPWDKTIFAE